MIIKLKKKMIEYFQNDVARINHALKVFDFSQIISEQVSLTDETKKIISYTAILHDIGIKEAEMKYNSSKGIYQEIEGPRIARIMLEDLTVSEKAIKRIEYIIANHHSYYKIDDLDFQIIVEGDIIVNIFEEKLKNNQISKLYENVFKTEPGKCLMNTLYLNK